jgi:tetratricopeptide (TPR) repeat protein
MLEREGRLEAAERTTQRALALTPDDPQLHRLRARVLDSLGRREEAAIHRAAAEGLDPTPALPDQALSPSGASLLIVLLEPPAEPSRRGRAPAEWPDGEVHAAIEARLAQRLPSARVAAPPAEPEPTVESRRAWLEAQRRPAPISLRVDRAWCGESIKDGRFGLAVLRIGLPEGVRHVRYLRDDPDVGDGCRARSVMHALEQALALPEVDAARRASGSRDAAPSLHSTSVHALFPDLDARIHDALREGRKWLAAGQLDAARAAFSRAHHIDPGHIDAHSFLVEVDRSLEISRQLANAGGDPTAARDAQRDERAGWRVLEPHLSSAEHRSLEDQLEAEQRLREDLLATLALLGSQLQTPDPAALAGLRRGTLPEAGGKGFRRAREQMRRAGDPKAASPAPELVLSTRVVHTPSGELLARYYFAGRSEHPLLMEEDTSGNGHLDRWVAWVGGTRREIWEEDRGQGLPDVHLVYAPDGRTLVRVELGGGDGQRPERVFVYREGLLRSDFQDTTGDGLFDEILHFGDDGSLALRERDLDHDGRIDVRTTYRSGRMVRREIMNPEVVAEFQ